MAPRNATTTNRGRTYRWRDETFDSVTTILSGGVPKPALTNWAAKSVAEWTAKNFEQVAAVVKSDQAAAVDLMKGAPWRERDKAALKGTDVHTAAENWVLGVPQPDFPKDIAPSMAQFLRFLDDFKPTWEMSEATVYSRAHRYAGTLDGILVIDGQRLLVDIKTGKGVYGEVALQLAAYRYAEFIGLPDGTEEPMPPVDGAAVIHVRPQSYQLIPVIADEAALRYFLYAQQIRHFSSEVSREVLLAPLAPGELTHEAVA